MIWPARLGQLQIRQSSLAVCTMRQFSRLVPKGRFPVIRSYATVGSSLKPGDSLHGFTVKQVQIRFMIFRLTWNRSRQSPNSSWLPRSCFMIRPGRNIFILRERIRIMCLQLDLGRPRWIVPELLIFSYSPQARDVWIVGTYDIMREQEISRSRPVL